MSIFERNKENKAEGVTEKIQEGKGFKRQWLTIPIGLAVILLLTRKKPEAAAAEVQLIDANGVAVPVQPTLIAPVEAAPAEVAIMEEITPELPELVFGPRGEAITAQPLFTMPTLPGTKVEEVVALAPEVMPALEVPVVTPIPVVEKKRVYDLFTGKIFQLATIPENFQMIDRLKYAEKRGLVSNVTVPGTIGSTSYKVIISTPDELDSLDNILSGKTPVPATAITPVVQPTLPVTAITITEAPEAPVPVAVVPELAPALPAPQPVTATKKVFVLPACSKATVAQNFDVYTWNWYKPELPANYKWQDATYCDGLHAIIFSTYADVLWSGGCMYTYKQKFTNVTALHVKATVTVKWSFYGYNMELGTTQIYDETTDKVVKESLTLNKYNTTIVDERVDGLDPTHVYAIRFKCKDEWTKQKSEARWKNVSVEATFMPGAPTTTIVTSTIPHVGSLYRNAPNDIPGSNKRLQKLARADILRWQAHIRIQHIQNTAKSYDIRKGHLHVSRIEMEGCYSTACGRSSYRSIRSTRQAIDTYPDI
jgi:hypothetical protein